MLSQTRDQLAKDRTILANQRTLLAFIRTAIMLFASGITFIKIFSKDPALLILGWTFLPVSVVVLLLGLILFIRVNRRIKDIKNES